MNLAEANASGHVARLRARASTPIDSSRFARCPCAPPVALADLTAPRPLGGPVIRSSSRHVRWHDGGRRLWGCGRRHRRWRGDAVRGEPFYD